MILPISTGLALLLLAAHPIGERDLAAGTLGAGPDSGPAKTYWEGAVRVSASRQGVPLGGVGYVEMTGYAEPLRISPR